MIIEDLLLALGLGHVYPKGHFETQETVQVELPDETYRDIQEVFWLKDKVIIRLKQND